MKRTVLALVAAALTVACCGQHVLAQQTASTQTRVAIVNIGMVLTKYQKAVAFKAQMEKLVEPYQVEGKKLKKEMLEWSEQTKHPKFDPKERDRYEQAIKGNQRKLEDLEAQVRKVVGTTQEEQIVTLYKEVQAAVQGYAQANGIHAVLGYGEQIEGDPYTFVNINRKMQGMDLGGLNPIFWVNGVDISQPVADTLNSAYQRAGGAAPSGITPTSATAPANQK